MTEYNFVGIIKRIINQHQEILNDWEIEFIASVYEWHVLKSGKLSDKLRNMESYRRLFPPGESMESRKARRI